MQEVQHPGYKTIAQNQSYRKWFITLGLRFPHWHKKHVFL